MRNILASGGAGVLRELAGEEPLVVLDFDGTLAPLVDEPDAAAMRPATRRLLRIAGLMYPCAVVSGRRRDDVWRRLDGIPLVGVVGNHGAEAGFGPVDRTPRAVVEEWLAALRRDLAGLAGLRLEDKGLSIAIHYRHAPARPAARRAILAAAGGLPGARVFGGKAVVNVAPDRAHDKGDAVERLLHRASRRVALYVGDDTTDEDAFRCPRVAVGVRVGRTRRSAAGYYVPGQSHVDELLRALIRARRRLDGLGDDIAGLERSMHEVEAVAGRGAC